MNRVIFPMFRIVGIGFLLNLVWENAQAPLYAGYIGFWQHLMPCFRGALGDVLIIMFLYGVFAIGYRDGQWIDTMDVRTILLLALTGMVTAVLIEYWALSIGRWSYNASMPMFFWTRAGLLPVLQMTVLPYAVFRLARRRTSLIG